MFTAFKIKLIEKLGFFGQLLYFAIFLAIGIMPLLFIDCGTVATVLILAVQGLFPVTNIAVWIWGLVCAISGKQDAWAFTYYVLFAIIILPETVCFIISLLRKNR